jgi:hypothetical protein
MSSSSSHAQTSCSSAPQRITSMHQTTTTAHTPRFLLRPRLSRVPRRKSPAYIHPLRNIRLRTHCLRQAVPRRVLRAWVPCQPLTTRMTMIIIAPKRRDSVRAVHRMQLAGVSQRIIHMEMRCREVMKYLGTLVKTVFFCTLSIFVSYSIMDIVRMACVSVSGYMQNVLLL